MKCLLKFFFNPYSREVMLTPTPEFWSAANPVVMMALVLDELGVFEAGSFIEAIATGNYKLRPPPGSNRSLDQIPLFHEPRKASLVCYFSIPA